MSLVDYSKNEHTFQDRVNKEATTFRPPGEKIYSYTRSALHLGLSSSSGKGKGKGKPSAKLSETDDDASVFEVYKACFLKIYLAHCKGF